MESCDRLCDNKAFNSRHDVTPTTYGASSLLSGTVLSMQTKSFQSENTTFNRNFCAQSDKHFSTDAERTQHAHNSHKNSNEDHRRDVTGQETTYLPSAFKSAAFESTPRERKRWVRPPLVGQASTSDSSTMIQDISMEAVTHMGIEDNSRHSVQYELPQPNYTEEITAEKKADYSAAISLSMNETQLHKALCVLGEVNDLRPYPSLQENGGKMKDCRDAKLLNKVWEHFDKISENKENFTPRRSSVTVSSPLHTQDQTYSPSGQNQDSSVIITETMGSGRAPSPASVSSVTSSRRLEWDSGADVGYQNYQPGECPPGEGLSSLERIALARGCSAAQRLEPKGTAGSMQQLNPMQFKPVTKSLNYISKVPMAVSTPVDLRQTGASSVAGTDSESEITPIVNLQTERCIFYEDECSHHHSPKEHTTPFVNHHVQSAECREKGGCNILFTKNSSSLTDLSECGFHQPRKYLLPRSQSYVSVLPNEDYRTKSFRYSNNGSFPLQHQYKRNNNVAACSLSSSSVATVVPNHISPRISCKHIQASAFYVPIRNSVGIQVSGTEKECTSLGTTSHFPCELDSSALRQEQGKELETTDADIIDRTDSNVVEDRRNEKCIHNSQLASVVKQNYTSVSQIQPQNSSFQKINNHNIQGNKTVTNEGSALCKGAHKRGSIERKWYLSATKTQQADSERHDKMFEGTSIQETGGKLNANCSKPLVPSHVNQNEEVTEKNSGTLDSITSSTQTAGSWFIGDTPQSTNGNQIENESGRRGSSGVVGSANSFEYLPGHVYENNTLATDMDLNRNAITEYSSSESSSHHMASLVDSKFKIIDDKLWGSSISSTLSTDLEKGIALLKDLLNSKSYNSDIKKKLVRQVVNRLFETNYAEDTTLLESNVPWVPPKSLVNSPAFVSGYITEKVSQEDGTDGQIVRRTMEREEVSGESVGEQGNSKPPLNHQPMESSTAHQAYIIADKYGKTVLSETSGLSSLSERIPLSENHADSRAETTTSTTQGCAGSSWTSTTFTRKGYVWKELTTQSEKEYEQRKHKPGQYSDKSVLLNLCETERENQLSWIRTEIHHLNTLKQLLEKQRSLRNGFLSPGVQNHKSNQKKIRNLVPSQKNSEVITEPESLRPDSKNNTSISELHVRKSHHCKRTSKVSELSNSKSLKELTRTDNFGSRIHQNLSDPIVKPAISSRRDIFTQFSTSAELCDKQGYSNCTINKIQLKEKAVQAPTSSDVSTNGDTYELTGDMLSDSTFAGRINVLVQTSERNSIKEKDSQGSKVTDANKYTRKASESDVCDETAVKQSKLNDTPLCCCDCKKLLAEIRSKMRFEKQRFVDKKSVEGHVKTSGLVSKHKYVSSSGRTELSKSTDDSSGRSCAVSSSRTLGDVIELTCDLDQVRASVATETVGNIGAQTTQSVSSLCPIQPQWYSLITKGTQKVSNKAGKNIGANCKVCPCCGALEDQNETISESQNTADEWKCSRCLKLEQDKICDRKCQICGILESQLQISDQDDIQKHDISWKCSDCLTRKLDNAKRVFDKRVHSGLQKDCEDGKNKQIDVDRTSNVASTSLKSPIGYILTLETSTDSVCSVEDRAEKKPLEEIKIKVTERNRHSISAKGKRKTFEKAVSKSNVKSCKENHKPVGSIKSRSSSEDEPKRNKHTREATLQEYLIAKRPDFIRNAEYRRKCLRELAYLRELRQKSKQRLLALASHISHSDGNSTASVHTGPLPPPPLAIKRIFSQRTMRAQTEYKYHNLPEVLSKKAEKKKKEDYRTNRLMAEIFARKLQKRVLKGDVNLSNSRSVISVI